MAEIVLTQQNFEQEVLHSDKTVLVDFWASWCGPCRMLAPILAEIAEEYEGKVVVGKVNVDEEPLLAAQFRVSSIPTVVLFKNGKAVNTLIGLRPKAEFVALLG
ncbi:MAG: thioredoxin [Clostridia bacterium]|nr:thioredoxin [Clostridia bacterium]